MLCYLNRLNDSVKEENKPDNHTVHADVKAIAWQCLKREYKPQSANYEDVLKAIASPNEDDDDKKDKAKVRLKYLENRLRLIRTKEPGYKVLFDLDPLAEYLAGLYLVDDCREDEEKWREFLAEADSKSGAPEAIKGFLLAGRDCYLAKVPEAKVTDLVPEELGRRADLDPEKVEQALLKQRIQRLISNLSLPDAEDRYIAAQALGNIGSLAKPAIPKLIAKLKDEDKRVRIAVADAMRKIGELKAQVPSLIELLEGNDKYICSLSASTLGKIGPPAKAAIPALIKALTDEDWGVGSSAASALGSIGSGLLPTLIDALTYESREVRCHAANALASKLRLGAVPALINALKSEDEGFRRHATSVLEAEAVAALREAYNDSDEDVRNAAEEALKKILGVENQIDLGAEAAKEAELVAALREACNNPDDYIRDAAEEALRKILEKDK